MFVDIDGSTLEGGGQILRTALSLSAILHKPVRISKIRAKRQNPGLGPQHLEGVILASKMCNAKINPPPQIGTTELEFIPDKIICGKYEGGVSTAGSIGLMIQITLPIAIFSGCEFNILLRGGTHTFFSPPTDYLSQVIVPILRRMGMSLEIKTLKRGYYPRGGGVVEVKVVPQKMPYHGIELLNTEVDRIRGYARVDNLPASIAERERDAALKILKKTGLDVDIDIISGHENTGTYVLLWTEGGRVLGSDALGKKDIRAEEVGKSAAQNLVTWLERGYTVDPHAADWLLIYATLAQGQTCYISEPTLHVQTCKYVIHTMLGQEVILINGDKIFANGTSFVR